jgi:Tfp pilus tip-associated adhesin PilY1
MNLTWKILKLNCLPNVNGVQNIITEVQFELSGVETINNIAYTASSEGVAVLEPYDVNNFTEFNNITKEQLVSWIESTVHYRVAHRQIVSEIEHQQKPQTIELEPPFGE